MAKTTSPGLNISRGRGREDIFDRVWFLLQFQGSHISLAGIEDRKGVAEGFQSYNLT